MSFPGLGDGLGLARAIFTALTATAAKTATAVNLRITLFMERKPHPV
jgi:hypothetical protein